jgi:hypothetical protein
VIILLEIYPKEINLLIQNIVKKKHSLQSWAWWLIYYNPCYWEVEISMDQYDSGWRLAQALKKRGSGSMAQTYNASYLGGRYQEDHGSEPARANSSRDPSSKIPNTKRGCQSGLSGRAPA